jgi:hypothetical protein
VIRFTAPATGNYHIQALAQQPYDNELYFGDTDFHVVKGSTELAQWWLGYGDAVYDNTVTLVQGETVDFVIGCGNDAEEHGSGLKMTATLTFFPLSPGTVQLTSGSYSASETAGSVRIAASRTGGSLGAANVNFSIGGGSATAGADYTLPGISSLHWNDGEMGEKEFFVTIINDCVPESDETCQFQSQCLSDFGSPRTKSQRPLEIRLEGGLPQPDA